MSFGSPTCNDTDKTNDDIDDQSLDYNNFNGNYYDPQSQPSTAVSKVQIKLNNLINNHKASLKFYNDFVNLFNEYISSNNFDQFAKLISRKSFIKLMESSYCVTHLWPKNRVVMLHDGSEVTAPVFDAKSMILDLLTNKITMDKSNIAERYNVFTGNVDDGHTANKQYGEIHTGDAWLPACNRFCTPNDDNNNLIEGYTRVTTKTHDGTKLILYTHPNFQGKKWYDWAYIYFEELNSSGEAIETYYPSKILGFVTIHRITEADIQCSEKPLIWSDLEKKFIPKKNYWNKY